MHRYVTYVSTCVPEEEVNGTQWLRYTKASTHFQQPGTPRARVLWNQHRVLVKPHSPVTANLRPQSLCIYAFSYSFFLKLYALTLLILVNQLIWCLTSPSVTPPRVKLLAIQERTRWLGAHGGCQRWSELCPSRSKWIWGSGTCKGNRRMRKN